MGFSFRVDSADLPLRGHGQGRDTVQEAQFELRKMMLRGIKVGKTSDVRIRRIYEASSPQDGLRILVDRLWPRGVSKQAAQIDEWLKAVAPSTDLRRWYGHEPSKFGEFKQRYADELTDTDHQGAWQHLVDEAAKGPVTLLTASKDIERSEAAVLAEWLTNP